MWWIPPPTADRVTFYSGASGSGKTINVCLRALGTPERRRQADGLPNGHPRKSAESDCYLMYLSPSAEVSDERGLARLWEQELALRKNALSLSDAKDQKRVMELAKTRDDVVERWLLSQTSHLTPSCSDERPLDTSNCRLTVVLDEMGELPLFARGVCARFKEITEKLARRYGLSPQNICVAIVGTGIDGTTNAIGSMPASYGFHQCGLAKQDERGGPLLWLLEHSYLDDALRKTARAVFTSGSDLAQCAVRLGGNARCAALAVRELGDLSKQRIVD